MRQSEIQQLLRRRAVRSIFRDGALFACAMWLIGNAGCAPTRTPRSDALPPGQIVAPVVEQVAHPFPPHAVRLLESPFRDAMDRDVAYLMSLDADRFLHRFREYAGLEPKGDVYGGWESQDLSGHSLGHWLTAMARYYAQSEDAVASERIAYAVSELASVQAAWGDGYLGGMPRGREVFDEVASGRIDGRAFYLNGLWSPWYNLHKLLAGLIDAYRFVDNEQALAVAIAFSDWIHDTFMGLDEGAWQAMLGTEYGGMNESLADLYSITGDERYLTLSRRFHDHAVLHPLAMRIPDLEGKHVNTQVPKLLGVLRQYEFVGEDSLRTMAEFFWDRVIGYHTYVIGGNSEREGFGPPGRLADRLGWNTAETCNTYNMMKLSTALFELSGDVKYAEYYERALYNHILASQDPETGMFTYYVSLKPGHFKTYSTPENSFWCCVGSGMENHVRYTDAIYFHDERSLTVNLFIPSEVTWDARGVAVRQETGFPETNRTRLTISSSGSGSVSISGSGSGSSSDSGSVSESFSLRVRHPFWADGPLTVTLNGEAVEAVGTPGGYMVLERTWRDGDVVDIEFPMGLRIETMPDLETRVAIMYGPIVLAGDLGVEGLPEGGAYADEDNVFSDVPDPRVPVLAAAAENMQNWVVRDDGEPLTFHTVGVGRPNDVTLIPFYRMHHRRYTVYWDLVTETN